MALNAQRNWDVSMADNLSRMMLKSQESSEVNSQSMVYPVGTIFTLPFRATKPAVHLPAEVIINIVQHIFEEKCDFRYVTPATKQSNMHACSLVSHDWNAATIPFLYDTPWLQGPNYDLFTRTICPSVNIAVRKSPLANFVRHLNLTMLIHQGSKSTTARLLGRTKNNLEYFAAPQASFSLNCFPALSKCIVLTSLDLALVSEAVSLKTLFETVSNLEKLKELHLPRSAGFGASLEPGSIIWPPRLEIIGLSGGLDAPFWYGYFRFPDTLSDIRITHCPKLDTSPLMGFLRGLKTQTPAALSRMTFANLPRLGPEAVNTVLFYLPQLSFLSVSVDYISPALLNPFYIGEEELPLDTTFNESNEGKAVKLEYLELTDSGDINDVEKFTPIDVLIAMADYRTLPLLTCVTVEKSVGWFSDDQAGELNELDELLVTQAKERGNYSSNGVGVKMLRSLGR
ncbi:hypothetical protein K461DRAFT_295637 [Myriangium duriaei CBS 260.36]|uniref:F-box domain-containing protein n=1 Tax=Myriangium duriaei CBS 260.36 TaxID=1168546 RepID=A0A9P4IXM6_9PEZI|nr:hypothetical protein K461DRAFT_295637 [Myriangium duriaei CBS 260.36]